MQKVKNVIKTVLVLYIAVLPNDAWSQKKIKGKYTYLSLYQEHYNYFEFFKNGTFEYHAGASVGEDEYGKGHYFIRNNYLILNYDLTELNKESYFNAKKYYNSKDSITISLNIYNLKGKPLDNISVYSFPSYKSTISNKRGKASLKLKKEKSNKKVELTIEGEFLARQIISLNGNSNYIINAYMSKSSNIGFGHPKAIKNQTIKYKILKLSKEEIKLKLKEKEIIFNKLKD